MCPGIVMAQYPSILMGNFGNKVENEWLYMCMDGRCLWFHSLIIPLGPNLRNTISTEIIMLAIIEAIYRQTYI